MNNYDLKIIKKKYGEKMSHLCRELFPSLLETKGLLSGLILDNFEPTRFLYENIIYYDKVSLFKNYIFSKIIKTKEFSKKEDIESPVQLMKKAGYILKECYTEEEIQDYKKYYAPDEELCTFKGGRLDKCRVFFAVKENVDDIKRKNFENPRRQDEYGTSVISIQFGRNDGNYLSIKNRYNHTVMDPDSTFSNDLDNIISGLTDSFEEYYGLKQTVRKREFQMPYYVLDEVGKFHRYNYEIDNIYYCPNNIIIENGVVKRLEPEKYILIDYFMLDLVNKEIKPYGYNKDTFINDIKNINKIEIKNIENEKEITILCDKGTPIIIRLDKYNRIIEYYNEKVTEVNNDFLHYNNSLRKINVPNLRVIGDSAFSMKKLTNFSIPDSVKSIGKRAFFNNELVSITIPNGVVVIGDCAFCYNKLTSVKIPNTVISIGEQAFESNKLTKIEIPKEINRIERSTFYHNHLTEIVIPSNIEYIGDHAFSSNNTENIVIKEGLKSIGRFAFLGNNIKNVEIPSSVISVGSCAFDYYVNVTKKSLPEKSFIKSK